MTSRVTGITIKDTDSFIAHCTVVHQSKYDYSNTSYLGNKQPLIICCPEHGNFEQMANSHALGRGCSDCGNIKQQKDRSSTLHQKSVDKFLRKANLKFDNKYTYHILKSSSFSTTKINIICPFHGEFHQLPHNHLKGYGCRLCERVYRWDTRKDFIRKAISTHGSNYDYSRVDYIDCRTLVSILCPTHGEFEQLPYHHVGGSGCQACSLDGRGGVGVYNLDRFEWDYQLASSPGYVYLIELSSDDECFHKIGISTNIRSRMQHLSSKYDVRLLSYAQTTLKLAFVVEQNVLKAHALDRHHPLISFGGHTECMKLNDDAVMDIDQLFSVVDETQSIQSTI